MYIEGDIFKIDNKEYRLRLINDLRGCWLEPVLSRNKAVCVTGGLNLGCNYKELNDLEFLNVRY
ncbi:hypothetical protein KDN24_06425 [Bacillus sp. Bva_UNVM-123]|uniref:hypothetical protein n=1 Tax=Bacillus sp. Bva_UNVM-123 TaxID=2829798 RepID=UPI00391EFB6B